MFSKILLPVSGLMASENLPEECIDQREIFPTTEVGTVFDHSFLPSSGVTRTHKARNRASPYPSRRPQSPVQLVPPSSTALHRHARFVSRSRSGSPVSDQHSDISVHSERGTSAPASTSRTSRISTRKKTPPPRARDESSESSDDDDEKIRKPVGEVGRPNRGGYNLKRSLKWPETDYEDVRVSKT